MTVAEHDTPRWAHLRAIEGGPAKFDGDTPAPVTHRCPLPDSAVMPCCGRSPFDVPLTDRLTINGPVTCWPEGAPRC